MQKKLKQTEASAACTELLPFPGEPVLYVCGFENVISCSFLRLCERHCQRTCSIIPDTINSLHNDTTTDSPGNSQ